VGTDGITGMLVPPSDPGALAAAIGRLLDDDDLRDRIGAAGRARVLKEFTWRATAEGTVGQYRALLEDCERWPAVGPDGRRPQLRWRWTRNSTTLVPPAGVPR
jgi:hypothetical protein